MKALEKMRENPIESFLLFIFLAISILFFIDSFNYTPVSRRLVVMFSGVNIILILFMIISENFINKVNLDKLKFKALDIDKKQCAVVEDDKKDEEGAEEKQQPHIVNEWLVMASIVLFFLLIYFTSFIIAIPIFTFILLRLLCKECWLTSILITVFTTIGIYLIFSVGLNLNII